MTLSVSLTGTDRPSFPTLDRGADGTTGAFSLDGVLTAAVDPSLLSPAIAATADRVAAQQGVDADALKRLIMVESSGNLGAVSPSGNHFGLMQLSRDIQNRYGVSNWRDPEQNISAGIRAIKADVLPRMAEAMGVEPGEVPTVAVYMGHQQGPVGGPAIMAAAHSGDERPAWKVLQEAVNKARASYGNPNKMTDAQAQGAIRGNTPSEFTGDVKTMTAGQFVDLWKDRIGEPAASRPFLSSSGPLV